MPPCQKSGCLGHAAQHTVAVVCTRCGGERWVPDPVIPVRKDGRPGPPIPLAVPFVCARCTAVLAGRNADDPVPSPAQQAAREAASVRLRQFPKGKRGG